MPNSIKVLSLALLLALPIAGCTPAQTAAAKRGATIAAVDLGQCAGRAVAGPEMRQWAQYLAQDDWRKVVGDVTGLGIGCILHALATGLTQDAGSSLGNASLVASTGTTAPTQLQKATLDRLAESCKESGQCADPVRSRAAILILEAIEAGKVALPEKPKSNAPSGQG